MDFRFPHGLRSFMRARSRFNLAYPSFEKSQKIQRLTFIKFDLLDLIVLFFVIRVHFTTLEWLNVFNFSKRCLKIMKAVTPKTTDQNICFLSELI